jgi:hypothetical protein
MKACSLELRQKVLAAALRGERVRDSVPRNYGTHTSLIGSMGLHGLVATLT